MPQRLSASASRRSRRRWRRWKTGLGAHLVERSTRRVRLTREGTHLLPLAQAVVEAAEAFTAAAAGTSDPLQGTLRLGIDPHRGALRTADGVGRTGQSPARADAAGDRRPDRTPAGGAARRGIGRGPDRAARRRQRDHGSSDLRGGFLTRAYRPGIRCQASVGCRRRRWRSCRCCCWTRAIACAIRPWMSARRPGYEPNSRTPGQRRWRPRCNA